MISISLLTGLVYVEPYFQPDSEYLIKNQRDVNYQILTILDGLLSILSHNDTVFDNYIAGYRQRILGDKDFYDDMILSQNTLGNINWYFNSQISEHLNKIREFFNKRLFNQDLIIEEYCTFIYTSSKRSNESNAFINAIVAGMGYSICGSRGFSGLSGLRYQIIHKVNVDKLYVVSGPISIEDVYIVVEFVVNNTYIVDNKVVFDFKSILYRNITIEKIINNEKQIYRDYIVFFNSSTNKINLKIAVPMFEVLARGSVEFRVKFIVNNNLATRLTIFVFKKG